MTNIQESLLQIQSEFLGVRVSKTEKNLIKKYAEENKITNTMVVRLALSEFFSNNVDEPLYDKENIE